MRDLNDRSGMLALWRRIEELLLSARSQIEVDVAKTSPPIDLRQFVEWVDHNEFGLAYEELVAVCALLHVEPPHDLIVAGQLMDKSKE